MRQHAAHAAGFREKRRHLLSAGQGFASEGEIVEKAVVAESRDEASDKFDIDGGEGADGGSVQFSQCKFPLVCRHAASWRGLDHASALAARKPVCPLCRGQTAVGAPG